VEAVKEMMSDPEYANYTLLTMGLESGFTSKTTFYNAFKKATGKTPNAYKNSNKISIILSIFKVLKPFLI